MNTNAELNSKHQKNNRVRTFRKFSPYICGSSSLHQVIVIECIPFVDSSDQQVGLFWVQVFGENGTKGSQSQSSLSQDSSQPQSLSPPFAHSQSQSDEETKHDTKHETKVDRKMDYGDSSPVRLDKPSSPSPTPPSPDTTSKSSSEPTQVLKPFVPPPPSHSPSKLNVPSLFSGTSTAGDPQIPLCSGHQAPCVSRQWRQQGPNNGRMYYVCASRPACTFKQWNDGTPFVPSSSGAGTSSLASQPSSQSLEPSPSNSLKRKLSD